MNKLFTLLASAAMLFGATGIQAQETTEPEAKSYNGYLNMTLFGTPVPMNQKTSVQITPTAEGKCNFLLPNLTIEGIGPLGDIALNDVTVETDFYGNQTYTASETPMTLLEGVINANVSLNGTISSTGDINLTIPVIWIISETEQQNLEVTFTSKPTGTEYSGYLNIEIEGAGSVAINSKASVYIVDVEDGVCNFLLPNLTLDDMALGDISLPGVIVEDNYTAKSYTKAETDMALLDGAINAKVSLDGTITTAGIADLKIPVDWTDAGMKINVTFSTIPVGTAIKGYLTIGFEGAAPMEINTPATVYITETGEGICNFLLPDLSIMGGFMNLGDVALAGVTVAEVDGTTTYTHTGSPMSVFLQGQELKTTVKLNGTANANGDVDMMIPVIWHIDETTDMPINVKFSTTPEGTAIEGYLSIGYEGDAEPFEVDTPATVYITDPVDGACTFLLPNLSIMGGYVNLGDIILTGVNVAEENGTKTYTHSGSEMSIDFLGNMLGATVKLNGTVDANGEANLLIPVIAHFPGDPENNIEGQDLGVNVTFSTSKSSGIADAKTDDSDAVIYGTEGAVKVAGVEGTVSVYTTVGVKVAEEQVNGEATIAAPKGIVIVSTPARTAKVVVK